MSMNELNNLLDLEFQKFAEIINRLNFQSGLYRKSFNLYIEDKCREIESRSEWSLKKRGGVHYWLHYKSVTSDIDLIVSSKKLNKEEEVDEAHLCLLKMYQSTLVDAYEAFEDFMDFVLIFGGQDYLRLWCGKRKELEKLQSRANQSKPYLELSLLRNHSSRFKYYEINNPESINYLILIVLIEKMRHLIVHNRGLCVDFKKISDKAMSHLNVDYVNPLEFKEYLEELLLNYNGNEYIDLLDYPSANGLGYHNMISYFLKILIQYAHLIKESLEIEIPK